MRLERLLANRGYCMRSDAGRFLHMHVVTVGGERLSKVEQRVDEAAVVIDGVPIDPGVMILLMHKPVGLTCSRKDEGEIVYGLLSERQQGRDPALATVGRLDKETSGLLLITDDGQLLHRLTSPKHHVPRVYVAELDRPLRGTEAAVFSSGKMLLEDDDKPLLPVGFELLGDKRVRLTLTEGRYHQVRRMFASIGNHVNALHRERFGPLDLAGIRVGSVRGVTVAEEVMLRGATAGGPREVAWGQSLSG